jgi:hypothetical protein
VNKKRCLAIVAAAVLLLTPSCTTPANQPPIITSLEAEADWTAPSGNLQVTCNASDPEGDELSYEWSANGGAINGEGATIDWTASDSVGSYNVTVTVIDSFGGEVTSLVTITVIANRPPTITSMVADADWTLLSGTLQVTCTASDPDGDELSYEWSATGGDISGTGPLVNWIAPQEVGTYHVTVVVTDGDGSSATDSLPISVVTGQPPNIEALLVTKDRYGHCYLLSYSGGYKVGKGQKYDIECIVSHTSELVYDWSCDGGEISEISEDGSMVTWIAPNTSMEVTVTVIVSDIAGYNDNESIFLEVVDCSPCTFGC